MSTRWATLSLAAMLCTAIAGAMQAGGSFVIDGPTQLPAGTSLQSPVAAMLLNDTTWISALHLTAPKVVIHHFEQTYVSPAGIASVATQLVQRKWELTDVRMELTDGDHQGYLGLHPWDLKVHIEPSEPLQINHHDGAPFTSHDSFTPMGRPESPPTYYQNVNENAFVLEHEGHSTFEGIGTLRIDGPDVKIAAVENTTVFTTGESTRSPTQSVKQWLRVEFFDGQLEIHSPEYPIRIAVGEARVAWSGPAQFTATAGTIQSNGAEFYATRKPVILDGDFEATLSPIRGSSAATLMTLSGDLRSTTLGTRPLAVVPADEPPLDWLPIVGVGAAIATGTVLAWRPSRRFVALRKMPPTPPVREPVPPGTRAPLRAWTAHHRTAAEFADANEDWASAIQSLRHLRKLGDSARLATWQARCHLNLGEEEAALACYEEGARLATSGEGEADLACAMIFARRGDGPLAVKFLQRALALEPGLAHEVVADARQPDDPFRTLREDPAFERSLLTVAGAS